MGWRLAVVVAPLDGRTLGAFVDEVYGAPQTLTESDVPANDALYPDNPADHFALAHNGFGWIFDWDLIPHAMTKPLAIRGRAWSFVLQSTINWYGFAEHKGGAFVRVRTGDSDNGIIVDEGAPSAAEHALVVALASPGQEDAAWDVWIGKRETFAMADADGAIYDNMTHDAIGEDIVFGLMSSALGFRIDRASPEAEPFLGARVMRIGAAKRPSLLGRLFSR